MELKFILESLLFSAQKPLSVKELRDVLAAAAEAEDADATAKSLAKIKESELTAALEQLAREHETAARSYRLACVAGAWQFVTQPEFSPWLKALVGQKIRPPRLSQPALETLAIIAYRQPITRAEVEQIRGVNVDGVMQTLMERGLVEAVGPRRGGGPPADLRHDAVVPRILRPARSGRFARRGRTPENSRRKTARPGHGRTRSGHQSAGAIGIEGRSKMQNAESERQKPEQENPQ